MDTPYTVMTTKALAELKIHPVFAKALIILLGKWEQQKINDRLEKSYLSN